MLAAIARDITDAASFTVDTVASSLRTFVAACSTSNDPGDTGTSRTDLYVAVALETAIGTLISLEQTGTLPPEGGAFISSTLAYGSEACVIAADPTMSPAEKRAAFVTGLADERAALGRGTRAQDMLTQVAADAPSPFSDPIGSLHFAWKATDAISVDDSTSVGDAHGMYDALHELGGARRLTLPVAFHDGHVPIAQFFVVCVHT